MNRALQAWRWPDGVAITNTAPYPGGHVFKDRTTGTRYLLSHDSGTDRLTLTTPVPDIVTTAPREPTLLSAAFGPQRFYVDNGSLLLESAAVTVAAHQRAPVVVDEPLWSFKHTERRITYRVYVCETTAGEYGLEKWEGVGRAITVTDIGCAIETVDVVHLGTLVVHLGEQVVT